MIINSFTIINRYPENIYVIYGDIDMLMINFGNIIINIQIKRYNEKT
jgi:hypothetical protein